MGAGSGVEERPLDAVAEGPLAFDPIHPRGRPDIGRHVAGFRQAKGADAREIFHARSHAIGEHVVLVDPLEGAIRGLPISLLAGPRIEQDGQAEFFVGAYGMARIVAAIGPGAERRIDARRLDRGQHLIEHAAVAAEGVGFEHRVDIAQPGDVVELDFLARNGVMGIGANQRIQDAFVARRFVPGHQGPAHVRAGPTVEPFGRLLPPIDEGLCRRC